jgi:hypothetical protein
MHHTSAPSLKMEPKASSKLCKNYVVDSQETATGSGSQGSERNIWNCLTHQTTLVKPGPNTPLEAGHLKLSKSQEDWWLDFLAVRMRISLVTSP